MIQGKHWKKICLYFILAIILAASLTGCGRSRKVKINGNYNEWIDAIEINKNSDIYCSGYYEYENGVTLCISPFKIETADEFKKILENHNAFVTRNPDYFPEDFDIDIAFKEGSQYVPLSFSNRTDSDLDKGTTSYIDLSEIDTEKTHCMRYVYVSDFYLLNRINTKFEVETIIIDYGEYGTHGTDMLEYFTGFTTIIVAVGSDVEETRVMNYLKEIQQATPNVEIYYKTYSKELTKYVPEENEN